MKQYKKEIRKKAEQLRKTGSSLAEISAELRISKSTASLWLRDFEMPQSAQMNIEIKRAESRKKSATTLKLKTKAKVLQTDLEVENEFLKYGFTKQTCKLTAALLYWGEGSKSGSSLSFINSDEKMIQTFLFSLRNGFDIDESKFRVLLHVHGYHDEQKLQQYWSSITSIPVSHFFKSYKKKSNGTTVRPGYKGSCSIRYYDVKVVRELTAVYNLVARRLSE